SRADSPPGWDAYRVPPPADVEPEVLRLLAGGRLSGHRRLLERLEVAVVRTRGVEGEGGQRGGAPAGAVGPHRCRGGGVGHGGVDRPPDPFVRGQAEVRDELLQGL